MNSSSLWRGALLGLALGLGSLAPVLAQTDAIPAIDLSRAELIKDPPKNAMLVGGRPVGLFLMTRKDPKTQADAHSTWYFKSTGEVYLNPDASFSADDLAHNVDQLGTFYLTPDKNMTVTWGNNTPVTAPIACGTSDFTWDGATFRVIKSFPISSATSSLLLGAYKAATAVSGGLSVSDGTTVTFLPDGTYTTSTKTLKPQPAGRWMLAGYYLVLNDTKGNLTRAVCFPVDDLMTAVKPDRFYFAGALYAKQP